MSEELQADDPAAAFEALREEVAQLRTLLEGRGTSEAVDYTPSLAALTQRLKGVEERLKLVQQQPALALTPGGHVRSLESAAETYRGQLRRDLEGARHALSSAAADLRGAVGQLRDKERQKLWLWGAAAAGAVAGVLAWTGLSGPIARVLPGQLAQKMAAATLGQDRAAAGQQLLASGDPSGWAQALKAIRIYEANKAAITACEKRRLDARQSTTCKAVLTLSPAS